MTDLDQTRSAPETATADDKLLERAEQFYQFMNTRRSTRRFSNQKIPIEILKRCILTAGTAPSGANSQPWFFALVTNPDMKSRIRNSAEQEEFEFYHNRASEEFLSDLKPLGTDWEKPHLEEAAALIVVFSKIYDIQDGLKKQCYYPKESVGIATGMLITALHHLGISTLTHTPSPMKFLNPLLNRPTQERPFLIVAAGYKTANSSPPTLYRKDFSDVCKIY